MTGFLSARVARNAADLYNDTETMNNRVSEEISSAIQCGYHWCFIRMDDEFDRIRVARELDVIGYHTTVQCDGLAINWKHPPT